MLMKRHLKTPEGWVKEINARDPVTGRLKNPKLPEGDCVNSPPLDYIEVYHTGTSPEQHFSTGLVMKGLAEGWMWIKDGILTLHAKPEDLHYKILRTPGDYPVTQQDVTGPDHETIHFYDCVLDESQHERYSAQTLPSRKDAAAQVAIAAKHARLAHSKEVPHG